MPKFKKYIETHWLFFALQGLISSIFGGFIIFTNNPSIPDLATMSGSALLCLGVIEFFSLIYRKHFGKSLALSIVLTVSEIIIAIMLIVTRNNDMVWPLALMSIYTLGRGIIEIILGFTAMTDRTDRFMWCVCGICACVIGFVILNSGNFLNQTVFLKFFGTYMMIYGITNLFYGIHNRNVMAEDKRLRILRRQKTKEAKNTPKNTLKNTPKNTPKNTSKTK